jgi:hypothetical protein
MAGKTSKASTPAVADMAANSEGTAKKRRGPGRPFVPGQSGNPNGRPKDVLAKLMREAESERAQASAASAILDRGCGKPTQPVDGRLDVTWHVSDQPMDPDEWRRTYAGK